jgi:hypothetical protein
LRIREIITRHFRTYPKLYLHASVNEMSCRLQQCWSFPSLNFGLGLGLRLHVGVCYATQKEMMMIAMREKLRTATGIEEHLLLTM